MSIIGKNPIPLPKDVKVELANGVIKVKGPKGELSQEVDSSIAIEISETEIVCTRSSDHKDVRAKHGLYRSLINNMVVGVSAGYKKKNRKQQRQIRLDLFSQENVTNKLKNKTDTEREKKTERKYLAAIIED